MGRDQDATGARGNLAVINISVQTSGLRLQECGLDTTEGERILTRTLSLD